MRVDEEITRAEAREFVEEETGSRHPSLVKGREFQSCLLNALAQFYSPTVKMLFLDEASRLVDEKKEDHNTRCSKGEDCDTYRGYEKLRFYIKQEVEALPKIVSPNVQASGRQPGHKVFISYSHADKDWLGLLKRHFKPIADRVLFWDDAQIKPGQKWKEEIAAAIHESKVAILLLSADFFNSEFITQNELPPLLRRASEEGVTVLNVFLKPCMLEEYPEITQYQGINGPGRTLLEMDEAARELTCVELVRQVRDMLAPVAA